MRYSINLLSGQRRRENVIFLSLLHPSRSAPGGMPRVAGALPRGTPVPLKNYSGANLAYIVSRAIAKSSVSLTRVDYIISIANMQLHGRALVV